MKEYPSISTEVIYGEPIIAFSKYDGSQIRAEWTKKNGFNKFGTRHRLLLADEKPLGEAISIFKIKYENDLNKLFFDFKFEKVTCFFEFFGPNSSYGNHIEEEHNLILFDIDLYKKGLLIAREFIKLFSNFEIPNIIYDGKVNKEFVENIKNSAIENMAFEGCVCKGGINKKTKIPILFKIKTNAWLDKLHTYCGDDKELLNKLI